MDRSAGAGTGGTAVKYRAQGFYPRARPRLHEGCSGYEGCIGLDVGKPWRLPRSETAEDGIAQAARDQKENAKEQR